MAQPFGERADSVPTFVTVTPTMRGLIENVIEDLILLLDEIDGDPDQEDDDPTEPGEDGEPSLGWTDAEAAHGNRNVSVWDADLEEEHDGREPDDGIYAESAPTRRAQSTASGLAIALTGGSAP